MIISEIDCISQLIKHIVKGNCSFVDLSGECNAELLLRLIYMNLILFTVVYLQSDHVLVLSYYDLLCFKKQLLMNFVIGINS